MRPKWVRWRDVFEGDRETLSSSEYLISHAQEEVKDAERTGATLRARRVSRTHFLELTEIIVSLWQGLFFKENIILDKEAEELLKSDGSLYNIDGKGTSLQMFIQNDISERYFVEGKVIVMTDAFGIAAKSLSDQNNLKLRPYWEILAPLSVPDWDIETSDPARLGKYNAIRQQYEHVGPRKSLEEKIQIERRCDVYERVAGGYQLKKYKAISDESGHQLTKDEDLQWEQIVDGGASVTVALPELPIAVYEGKTWIKGVVEENLRHYNLRSTKDAIELQQGYQRVYVAADGLDGKELKIASENLTMLLPKDSQVFTVEPVSTADLRESCADAVETTFKVGLNQLRSLPASSKENMAADSMQEEKANTIALVQLGLTEIERVVNESLQHHARFRGRENFKGKIELCKDISDEDYTKFLEVWNAMADSLKKVEGLEAEAAVRAIKSLGLEKDVETKMIEKAKTTKFKVPEAAPSPTLDAVLNGG